MKRVELNIFLSFLCALFCMLMPNNVMAQDNENKQIKINVTIYQRHTENGKEKLIEAKTDETIFYYGYVRDRVEAEKVKRLLLTNKNTTISPMQIMEDYGIIYMGRKEAELPGYLDMYIVVVPSVGTEDLPGGSVEQVQIFKVEKGVINYPLSFKLLTFPLDVPTIIDYPRPDPGEDHGPTQDFYLNLCLDTIDFKSNTRLIVQPIISNCDSGEIAAYLPPYIFEGEEYHLLQNKRMAYDFYRNDPLAFVVDTVRISYITDSLRFTHSLQDGSTYKSEFFVNPNDTLSDTLKILVKYKKPNNLRHCTFRCDWKYSLEDYHRLKKQGISEGTCLVLRPFRFLELSTVLPEMELTEEFQEPAQMQNIHVEQDLKLRFEQGGTRVINDSLNIVEREKLDKELKNSNILISKVVVIGTASPDGNDKRNSEIALKRARAASDYLKSDVKIEAGTLVYTWLDVAERLHNDGYRAEAEEIRNIVNSNNNERDQDAKIAKLSYYKSVVVPVLPDFRIMKFSYNYTEKKILSADEVVKVYYSNKQNYISGNKKFSMGDYYNLFKNVKDSAELDTITIFAYNHLKSLSNYRYVRIAPFVFNRMQRLLQKQNNPDTLMLKAFFDDSQDVINQKRIDLNGRLIEVVNRDHIVATQAISYYMLQDYSKAQFYINRLREKAPIKGLEELMHYVNLYKYKNSKDADHKKLFDAAVTYVMAQSDQNRAVIYTEFDQFRNFPGKALAYVNILDDNNPIKWYLKGVLSSREKLEHRERPVRELFNNPTLGSIPQYLAYLHKSFTIDPSFKKHYFKDANITEELRRRYPYTRKNLLNYEKIFIFLYERDRKEQMLYETNMNITK